MSSPEEVADMLRLRLDRYLSKHPVIVYVIDDGAEVGVSVDISMVREREPVQEKIEKYVAANFDEFSVTATTREQVRLAYDE